MLGLILTLVVVGVLLWLLETYVPMNATIKRVIQIIVIFAVVIWLLQEFGILSSLQNVPVPKLR